MSHVVRVATVEYDENHSTRREELAAPTCDRVRTAFKVGSGHRRWFAMVIDRADGSFLNLDGSDGLFYLLVTRPDGAMFSPVDPAASDEAVTILAGGVRSTVPRRHLCEAARSEHLLKAFFDGTLDTAGWEAF